MAEPTRQLAGLAELFTDLTDTERLDKAADLPQLLRQMARRAGATSPPSVYERFIGAAEAFEVIAKGRTVGADTGQTDDIEGES